MQKILLRPWDIADQSILWKWKEEHCVNNFEQYEHAFDQEKKRRSGNADEGAEGKDSERGYIIINKSTGQPIGSAILYGITEVDATLNFFIAEPGSENEEKEQVVEQLLHIAFGELHLNSIWASAEIKDLHAIDLYNKAGFAETVRSDGNVHLIAFAYRRPTKVSVFVMTYNHANFIKETLDGILNQQCNFDFDVIVGDDFSKDSTREILKSYALKHPNLKLILHSRNFGPYANQMAVFKSCHGEYVAMCEGDDYWTDTTKLQAQVDFLDANSDYSLVFHRTKVYNENTGAFVDDSAFNQNTPDTTDLSDIVKSNYIRTPTALFRNNIVFPSWYQIDTFPGDWPIFILSAMTGKIKFIDKVMAVYRIHLGGTYSMIKSTYKKEEKTFNDIYGELKKNGFDDIAQWVKQRNDYAYLCEYGMKGNTSRLKQASVILSKGSWKLKMLFWVPIVFKNSEAAFKKLLNTKDL